MHISGNSINLIYDKNFLTKDESDVLFSFCEESMVEKSSKTRTNTLYGDEGLTYTTTYTQKTTCRKAELWPEEILPIKKKLEGFINSQSQNIQGQSRLENISYNFCSVMKYPHGGVVIKKHRDKEMVSGTSICGISVGATRRIQFSPPSYIKMKPVILELPHGSLYCMLPPTNDAWTHEILAEKDCNGEFIKDVRYSLTFRNVKM